MPPLSTTATAATFYLPWPVPALPLPRRPGAGHLSCVDTPRQSRVLSRYLHVSRYGYLYIYTSLATDTVMTHGAAPRTPGPRAAVLRVPGADQQLGLGPAVHEDPPAAD